MLARCTYIGGQKLRVKRVKIRESNFVVQRCGEELVGH
jgi:hypothetical protein